MSERQIETAQLCMSDLHYGRSTDSYNPDVFRDRLVQLSKRLARIRELKAGYEFDGLVVNILGDVVDGADIYRGQTNYQANPNVRQQAHEVAELLAKFLREQIAVWGSVRVEATPGNHGRSGMSKHEAENWDLVAYDFLKEACRGPIEVHYDDNEADCFIRVSQVRGHKYLLYHGQEILGYQGIPYYGIDRRITRWYNSLTVGPVDAVFLGHFHTSANFPIGTIDAYLTGTMVTGDAWAFRRFGTESSAKWWLLGTSDHYPVTWQYKVMLA